jgi:hypothetical protein
MAAAGGLWGRTDLTPKFTQKTVKHPAKVMVWDCFSWQGRGGLEFLKKGEMMNSQRYLRMLEGKLELFMRIHKTSHFLQDGAPCRKVMTKWSANRPHFTLIKLLGNSPDLNPIENVWNFMKLQLKSSICSTIDEWITEIKRLWIIKMDNC